MFTLFQLPSLVFDKGGGYGLALLPVIAALLIKANEAAGTFRYLAVKILSFYVIIVSSTYVCKIVIFLLLLLSFFLLAQPCFPTGVRQMVTSCPCKYMHSLQWSQDWLYRAEQCAAIYDMLCTVQYTVQHTVEHLAVYSSA